MQAKTIATITMGSFATDPDSAIARRRKAPANPRAALPSAGKALSEDSRRDKPDERPGGREDWTGATPAVLGFAAYGLFGCGSASLDAALCPLRLTDSNSAMRDSRSRRR